MMPKKQRIPGSTPNHQRQEAPSRAIRYKGDCQYSTFWGLKQKQGRGCDGRNPEKTGYSAKDKIRDLF
jgi:hypothetical protein